MRFFIIGDGEEKQRLKEYCQELKLGFTEWNNNQTIVPITFTSWIKDIDWANAGLDIITLTSLNEGTPVSLIEGQACNKPIVTTNVGGVENVTRKNETAFIVETSDQNGFVGSLLELINDENLRREMGSKGWLFVSEKYSYTRLVKDVEQLYHHLLSDK